MEVLFDHDRLEVYRVARQFGAEIRALLLEVPRGHADSKRNLKRAAQSITRNIAEGAGRWTLPDKIHFYHIARGSATECAAALDELVDWSVVAEQRVRNAKETLVRVVAMLVAMIRSLEARDRPTMDR